MKTLSIEQLANGYQVKTRTETEDTIGNFPDLESALERAANYFNASDEVTPNPNTTKDGTSQDTGAQSEAPEETPTA